jgi:hypothetical protein
VLARSRHHSVKPPRLWVAPSTASNDSSKANRSTLASHLASRWHAPAASLQHPSTGAQPELERHASERPGTMTPAAAVCIIGFLGILAEIPARWEQGFPVPFGAHSNTSPSGATSLSPGHNYTLQVYDVTVRVEVMTAFYAHYLPEATRSSADAEVRFSMPGGSVTLTHSG